MGPRGNLRGRKSRASQLGCIGGRSHPGVNSNQLRVRKMVLLHDFSYHLQAACADFEETEAGIRELQDTVRRIIKRRQPKVPGPPLRPRSTAEEQVVARQTV